MSQRRKANLRLEELESRIVPSAVITPNPVDPTEIDANEFQVVVVGDFDADGDADDAFFWNPTTGQNRLIVDVNDGPGVEDNPVNPTAINNNDFVKVVAGDFDIANPGDELFFWNPSTGKNRLVEDLNGTPTVITNFVAVTAINGNDFKEIVAGNFSGAEGAGAELFFWNPSTGKNRLVENLDGAGAPTVITNAVPVTAINGNAFVKVVAGDFSLNDDDQLFFWNPGNGANLLVEDVGSGSPEITNNPVNPLVINNNAFTQIVAINDDGADETELFFWNPSTGKNRLVGDVDGEVDVVDDFVPPTVIDGNDFALVVAGDFDDDGDDQLFFWNPLTGENIVADE